MNTIIEYAKSLYTLDSYEVNQVFGHNGGCNITYVCSKNGENKYIIRISLLGDRTEEEYLAETEFVHYLAQNDAPVADVLPSVNGKYVESIDCDGRMVYVSLFTYAKGILIADNGYHYRKGVSLSEYFYNTGKALGKIHSLSKNFTAIHHRINFFDKYNMEYINTLIPESYRVLRDAISDRLKKLQELSMERDNFGLVHFDFSNGNYHINMSTGELTVFDFDNCMYSWYMFDLANLWTHGVGWYRNESSAAKRMEYMNQYFKTILEGYQSETNISKAFLEQLPLFIDIVLVENIVDEFECCARVNEEVDYEDIENAAQCLINRIPYAGFGAE